MKHSSGRRRLFTVTCLSRILIAQSVKNPPTISDESVSACDLLNTKQDCQPIHRDTNLHSYIHSISGLSRFRVAVEIVTAPHINKQHVLKLNTAEHVYITPKFKGNVANRNELHDFRFSLRY